MSDLSLISVIRIFLNKVRTPTGNLGIKYGTKGAKEKWLSGSKTKNQSSSDLNYINEIEQIWLNSEDSTVEKLEAFTKFVSRQSLTKFLARSTVSKNN